MGSITFNGSILSDTNFKIKLNKKLPVTFKGIPITINGSGSDSFEMRSRGGSNYTDPDQRKLLNLGRDYKSSNKEEDRIKILDQERLIMDQELEYPAKYLDRAKSMKGISVTSSDPEINQITQLRINALKGLNTYYLYCNDTGLKPDARPDFYLPIIERILKETPDSAPLAENLKTWSIHFLNALHDHLDKESNQKIQKIAYDLLTGDTFDQCKTFALTPFNYPEERSPEVYNKLQNYFLKQAENASTPLTQKQFAVYALGKVKAPKFESLLPEILSNPAEDKMVRNIAVWAAGSVKTDRNFDILSKIIKDSAYGRKVNSKNFEDICLNEMALYSLAEYAPEKIEQLNTLFEKIINPANVLSETTQALYDRVNEKQNIEEYFINNTIADPERRKIYKQNRDQYVEGLDKLNKRQLNYLDVGLLPFREFLGFLNYTDSKMTIENNSVTSVKKDLVGVRIDDGRFWDFVGGVEYGNGKNAFVTTSDFDNDFAESYHTAGHEMSHQVLKFLRKIDRDAYNRFKEIYNKAVAEDRCVNNYAKGDIDEYFAEGYEVYLAKYRPHARLINPGDKEVGIGSTKTLLKFKDPEFYQFLEELIEKYGTNENGAELAKKGYQSDKNRVIRIKIN